MADTPTHKQVGSEKIPLTPEEAVAIKAAWEAADLAAAIEAQQPPVKPIWERLDERITALELKSVVI